MHHDVLRSRRVVLDKDVTRGIHRRFEGALARNRVVLERGAICVYSETSLHGQPLVNSRIAQSRERITPDVFGCEITAVEFAHAIGTLRI